MNYLESVKYLKNYPPDILALLKNAASGFSLQPEGSYLRTVASDLGTNFESMIKNKTIDPKLRARIIKQMGLDKEEMDFLLARDAKIETQRQLADRFKHSQYAGGYGE